MSGNKKKPEQKKEFHAYYDPWRSKLPLAITNSNQKKPVQL